jgi:osmotically-inducible protein OsmY
MTTASLNLVDIRLRDAVVRQLAWEPEVDASAIGVAARRGVVTLTGFIDSYTGKLTAERVAKQVRGVRAVANDITVRLAVGRTDPDIAQDVAQALKLMPSVADNIQAVVHHGHVTLTGKVEWLYQTEHAEAATRHVRGVVGVSNRVEVNPKAGLRDVKRRIVGALHRNADLDARRIDVAVASDVVRLKGTVTSWTQREAAERAAGNAPGVKGVDNQIVVEPPELDEFDTEDDVC